MYTPDDGASGHARPELSIAMGGAPTYGAGSTDSNVPMQLGIPAVTLGGGGVATRAHSLDESFDSTDSHLGPQAVLLTLVALVR